MTENYEQELKLIEAVEKSRGMEWIDELENFGNYFNPAHMRQRIEREMAKDARIKELETLLNECVMDINSWMREEGPSNHSEMLIGKAKELLK